MNVKICLVFGIFPEENYQEIISNSKGGMQNAADALQKSIIAGLSNYSQHINILNFPFIGSYPKNYKSMYSPDTEFKIYGANGKNIKFLNISIIKHYFIYRKARKAIASFLQANSEDDVVVIVYSLNPSLLYACAKLKAKFRFSLISIVPDLYEYTSMQNNSIRTFFKNWNYRYLRYAYKYIDGYVILTEQMIDALPIGNKPYVVVEGIYNSDYLRNLGTEVRCDESEIKTVLYTGTLSSLYGLPNLISAFKNLKNSNYRLLICGGGADDKVKDLIANNTDNRIVYKGLLPRPEALKLQQQATLLVNPRTSEGEFTKYSFPSKTMEYFASGTPTLIYKLSGIPNEYYSYCYWLEDTSINALTNKLHEVLETPPEKLLTLGASAQDFIFSKKNPKIQTYKIIKLIESCQYLKTKFS